MEEREREKVRERESVRELVGKRSLWVRARGQRVRHGWGLGKAGG